MIRLCGAFSSKFHRRSNNWLLLFYDGHRRVYLSPLTSFSKKHALHRPKKLSPTFRFHADDMPTDGNLETNRIVPESSGTRIRFNQREPIAMNFSDAKL